MKLTTADGTTINAVDVLVNGIPLLYALLPLILREQITTEIHDRADDAVLAMAVEARRCAAIAEVDIDETEAMLLSWYRVHGRNFAVEVGL